METSKNLSLKKVSLLLRIIYPVWMVVGMFSLLYVPSTLIIQGDMAATAAKINSNQLLFRLGICGSLMTQLIFIFAVLFLFKLFEEINKNIALLMVVLALVSVPIAMLNTLSSIAVLLSLNNPTQLQLFLILNEQGIIIASIFWGLWLFPLGRLVYTSGFFPKLIGMAVYTGGFGYLLGSFTQLLFPGAATVISVFQFMTFGEVVFLGWLVIGGPKLREKLKSTTI